MKMKFFFHLFFFFAASYAFAQVEVYPLSQYSVGQENEYPLITGKKSQLRTTALPQIDTLKLPFIEDFSGPFIPLEKITTELFEGGPTLVYELTYIKLHQLTTGDSIRVFNTNVKNISNSLPINGLRFVKVIDKYTLQLFNDPLCTTPTLVNPLDLMTSTNWVRLGTPYYSTKAPSTGFLNDSGGVFINNNMALNPVNIGVASFDGANYNGIPYSSSSTKQYTDKLTSLPFDLSTLRPQDSIYFSFYWQKKGLGDSPLKNEFLSLEFKNNTNTWKEVQKIQSEEIKTDTFKRIMIPIIDSAYLHTSFQYRFRSFGAPNGRFNVWNIDYIYIDTNRSWDEGPLKDIMIIETSQVCLKNYSSLPYKHFNSLSLSDQAVQIDSSFAKYRDSKYKPTDGPGSVDYYHQTRDNLGSIFPRSYESVAPGLELFTYRFPNTIQNSLLTKPYVLKEEFSFAAADTTDRFDLSFNNFTPVETIFHNYYAYDDNIPESTILTKNTGGIKIGNSYKILKTDTLTAIDYCFLRNNGPDMTGTEIFMNVWISTSSLTVPAELNQKIKVKYSTELNGFVRYELTTPIILQAGETYIFGFTQNALYPLFTGYDRNNDRLDKIFLSLNNTQWIPYSSINLVTGALMIRPVFDNNELLTNIQNPQKEESAFTIFPNPAQSQLHFTGEPESISIYDISGLLIFEKNVSDLHLLSTETLTNGMYLLVLSKGTYKEVKRLIIQK